jgi:hypothetical protein
MWQGVGGGGRVAVRRCPGPRVSLPPRRSPGTLRTRFAMSIGANVVYPEPVGALKDGLVERRGASGTARTQLVGVVFLGDLAVVGLSTRSWGVAAGPGFGLPAPVRPGPGRGAGAPIVGDDQRLHHHRRGRFEDDRGDDSGFAPAPRGVGGRRRRPVRRPDPTDAAAQSPLIHQYKGYDVRVEAWTFSQGDAGFDPQPVTGPVPPDVGAALTLAAAANEAELIATAEHFLRGKHPYQASRGLVRTVPGALPSAPSFELQTSSMNVRRDDGMTVSSRPQLTVNLTATTAARSSCCTRSSRTRRCPNCSAPRSRPAATSTS